MFTRLLFTLSLVYTNVLFGQNCTTNGGNLQESTLIQCYANQIDFVLSNEILDANDQVFYCILSDTAIIPSNVVTFSNAPSISNLHSLLPNCGIYYAVAIVSNSNGGSIDFNDLCLSASNLVMFMHDKDPMASGTWNTIGSPTSCTNEYIMCNNMPVPIEACPPGVSYTNFVSSLNNNGGFCNFDSLLVYDTLIVPYKIIETYSIDSAWVPGSNAPPNSSFLGNAIFYGTDTLLFSDRSSGSSIVTIIGGNYSTYSIQFVWRLSLSIDTIQGPILDTLCLNCCDQQNIMPGIVVVGSINADIGMSNPIPLATSGFEYWGTCNLCNLSNFPILNSGTPLYTVTDDVGSSYDISDLGLLDNSSSSSGYIVDACGDQISYFLEFRNPSYLGNNLSFELDTLPCGQYLLNNFSQYSNYLCPSWPIFFDYWIVDFDIRDLSSNTVIYSQTANTSSPNYNQPSNFTLTLNPGSYLITAYNSCFPNGILRDSILVLSPLTSQCNDNNCLTLDTFNLNTCACDFIPITPPTCDDGLCATLDTFNLNTCNCDYVAIAPLSCDDNNCLTTDTFNTTTCICEFIPITPPSCDDGLCTTLDTFNSNTCNCDYVPIVCDDGDCLTLDSFNLSTCLCEYFPIPPVICDDNNCLTTDTYNTNTCNCEFVPITPPNCDDGICTTLDTFNVSTCLCEYIPIPPVTCDDNNCLTTDTYNTNTCNCEFVPITSPICDDGSCFTLDTFNLITCNCEFIPITPPQCDDGLCSTLDTFNLNTCNCDFIEVTALICDDYNCLTIDSYNPDSCECFYEYIDTIDCNDNNEFTYDVLDSLTCTCNFIPLSELFAIPDAFSPNNDGINDTYGIVFYLMPNQYELEFSVANRYGQEVFSSTSIEYKWDGNYLGVAQPQDLYNVVGEIRFKGVSKSFNFSHQITLIR